MLTTAAYERKLAQREAGKLERKATRILQFVRNNRSMTREFRVLRCKYAGQLMLKAWKMYGEVSNES